MATNPRKRQQKRERHAAKRKEKKQQLIREQPVGLGERLTAAAKCPVLHTWVTENLGTQGMGSVLLSRSLPDGSIAVALFLLDRFCLGVKDALAEIVSRSVYNDKFVRKMQSQFESRTVSPATARKLVEAGVAYALDLGFQPHADYQKAKLLFGDINPTEAAEEFEFGKDGKPFFIAGPYDNPERCRQILNTLVQSRGPNGFHYTIPFGPPDKTLPDALKQGKVRVIGEHPTKGIVEDMVDFDNPEA